MSSVPERRFTVALALPLLLLACGSVGEPTSSNDVGEETPSKPTPYSAGSAPPTTSCSPSVALGDPVAAPLPSFACPAGWDARGQNGALLLSGRFTSAREMVDALCAQSPDPTMGGTGTKGDPAGIGIEIDFEHNDVIAVASDGAVALHRRAGELWIRHVDTCERAYRTSFFVVPKDVEPQEQICTAQCQ